MGIPNRKAPVTAKISILIGDGAIGNSNQLEKAIAKNLLRSNHYKPTTVSQVKFILASASPARRRLLEGAGIQAKVVVSDFDESLIETADPIALVQTLASCKAQTVAQHYEDSLVLGCDSVLSVNGEIHGKPDSPEIAIARWQQMRAKVGILYTGHALIDRVQNKQLVKCGITKVYFANITDKEIKAYVATGEPLKCAGCFALEGRGGLFVDRIEGCHTNVIGLSLPLLRQMLDELGYDVTNFWS